MGYRRHLIQNNRKSDRVEEENLRLSAESADGCRRGATPTSPRSIVQDYLAEDRVVWLRRSPRNRTRSTALQNARIAGGHRDCLLLARIIQREGESSRVTIQFLLRHSLFLISKLRAPLSFKSLFPVALQRKRKREMYIFKRERDRQRES